MDDLAYSTDDLEWLHDETGSYMVTNANYLADWDDGDAELNPCNGLDDCPPEHHDAWHW